MVIAGIKCKFCGGNILPKGPKPYVLEDLSCMQCGRYLIKPAIKPENIKLLDKWCKNDCGRRVKNGTLYCYRCK